MHHFLLLLACDGLGLCWREFLDERELLHSWGHLGTPKGTKKLKTNWSTPHNRKCHQVKNYDRVFGVGKK
jgi:hypothetical protein